MPGSRIIMMLIQTVMLSERFPILTRLTVTEPSLSLTVLLPISNCMVTIGATATVSAEQNYVLKSSRVALVKYIDSNYTLNKWIYCLKLFTIYMTASFYVCVYTDIYVSYA